jgi:hypothetical protein
VKAAVARALASLLLHCHDLSHWFAKVRKKFQIFCAQRIQKLFLQKVLSNGDTLYPLVVF